SLRARTLPTTKDALSARIELLRGLIAQQQGDDWREPAARLGADLLTPLEAAGWLEGIDRLAIVPHAELNYLPFAALIRTHRDGPRLLVDDYALSVLPAASLLVPVRRSRPAESDLLALAPEPARLPHSVREVEEVAALFAVRPRLLIGQAASEQSFKSEVGRHRVVHVATHGFYDRFNPLFSGLELGRGGSDDGRLQVFEILGLELRAQLVTLSACETALSTGELSDVPIGEEFVGLTRAFLSAGASSVVASLWDISDGATPDLMRSFYANTRRQPLSDALAIAQRQRAHAEGRQSHPFFWAPFVVVGVAANVDLGSVNSARR
ncbi:MAG: CHAT domain-containing protein, partial [Candidatus Limnocylindrales bacterium]